MRGIITAIIMITIGHHLLPANLQSLSQHGWVMRVVSKVIHSLMVMHFLNSRVTLCRVTDTAQHRPILSNVCAWTDREGNKIL